jgi:hypothetical protein
MMSAGADCYNQPQGLAREQFPCRYARSSPLDAQTVNLQHLDLMVGVKYRAAPNKLIEVVINMGHAQAKPLVQSGFTKMINPDKHAAENIDR